MSFVVGHLWFGAGLVVLTGLSVGLAAWARVGLGWAQARVMD